MSKTLINVSFCCAHFKGGDGINQMSGEEHARWLECCIDHLTLTTPYPIFVSITGWPGILNLVNAPNYYERDTFWRIYQKARLITEPANPGHQVGAALCIRLGLEAAGKLGYDYMIHTAEDVVPHLHAIRDMVDALEEGADYAGEIWGEGRNQLNSQFFGCRVQSLVGPWDACQVSAHGCAEAYMRHIVMSRVPRQIWARDTGLYRTTHDFSTWTEWRKQVEAERVEYLQSVEQCNAAE